MFKNKDSASGLFEKAACDLRLTKMVAAKFKPVTKVRALLTHLVEDDRLACEYRVTDTEEKLLVGGYFRFYDPGDDMIYVSPFKRSIQFGLASITSGRKLRYLKWGISSIVKLYVKNSVEERIQSALKHPQLRRADSSGSMTITTSTTKAPTPEKRRSLGYDSSPLASGNGQVIYGGGSPYAAQAAPYSAAPYPTQAAPYPAAPYTQYNLPPPTAPTYLRY